MRLSSARITARPLVAVLALSAALAVAPAAHASTPGAAAFRASHAKLTRRTFVRHTLALIRQRSAADTVAGRAPSVIYASAIFHVKSHDSDFPDWFAGAFQSQGDMYVAFATGREGENGGQQEYEWTKEVPAEDVVIGSGLVTVGIHTGTDLGAFGSIDMSFTPSHIGLHRYHCGKTGKLVAFARSAQGSFSGTMTFMPGGPGFPTAIHATHPHARLERFAATGARCPGGQVSRSVVIGGGRSCYAQREFSVATPDGGQMRVDPEYGFTDVATITTVDGFSEFRAAFADPEPIFPGGGHSPVKLTATGLTIDGDKIGDVFSGTLVFDRSTPAVVHVGPRCTRMTTPFLWDSGSLDIAFANGTYSFTGADQDARVTRITRTR